MLLVIAWALDVGVTGEGVAWGGIFCIDEGEESDTKGQINLAVPWEWWDCWVADKFDDSGLTTPS